MNRNPLWEPPDGSKPAPDLGVPIPIPDAELAFKMQQAQGAIIADFNRLVHGELDGNSRKHLAKHLVTVAEDLLRPIPVVIDARTPVVTNEGVKPPVELWSRRRS